MLSTRSFWQRFESSSWSTYDPDWDYWTTQPTFERKDGDIAAKVTNAGGQWQGLFNRTPFNLTDGKAVVVQFQNQRKCQPAAASHPCIGSGYYGTGSGVGGLHANVDDGLYATRLRGYQLPGHAIVFSGRVQA